MVFVVVFLVYACLSFNAVAMEGNGKQCKHTQRSLAFETVVLEEKSNLSELFKQPKLFSLIKCKASLDEIKKEIEAGADVNEEYNYSTPLNTAVQVGDISLVNLLISAGAQINKGVGADKSKPLNHAIRRNDYSMISLLLSSGAKVNSSFFHIFTPLYEAISIYKIFYEYKKESKRNASFAIIQLLLQHNAKIEWPVFLNTDEESEKARFASIIKEAQSALDAKQIIVYESSEAVLFGKN